MQNFGGNTLASTSRATLTGTPLAPDVKGTGIPAPALIFSHEMLTQQMNAKPIKQANLFFIFVLY